MIVNGRRSKWIATMMVGVGIVVLGWGVAAIGLDNADKIASVIGACVAFVGLVLTIRAHRGGNAPPPAQIEAQGDISGIAAIGHSGSARQAGSGDESSAPPPRGPASQGSIKAGGSISGIAAIGDGRKDVQDQNR